MTEDLGLSEEARQRMLEAMLLGDGPIASKAKLDEADLSRTTPCAEPFGYAQQQGQVIEERYLLTIRRYPNTRPFIQCIALGAKPFEKKVKPVKKAVEFEKPDENVQVEL